MLQRSGSRHRLLGVRAQAGPPSAVARIRRTQQSSPLLLPCGVALADPLLDERQALLPALFLTARARLVRLQRLVRITADDALHDLPTTVDLLHTVDIRADA